jgi:hypothetical protein
VSDADLRVCHDLASRFADAHATPYSLQWGHLRWAAAEALEQVDIPTEDELADMDSQRAAGWKPGVGELP